jgi:acyl carrier protein
MTRDEIRRTVVTALARVAPEIDLAAIDANAPIRRTYDLDSMDFLNFIIALHRTLGVTVPELDYTQLATVNGAIEYLMARLSTSTPAREDPRATG